ncbi:MAG: hypothetical protein LBH43_17320 [Treponema sp.]|jgi:hypothetical protein|nr:hypothetical protein [Treponema sp.]
MQTLTDEKEVLTSGEGVVSTGLLYRELSAHCLGLEKEIKRQKRAMFQMTAAYQQATKDLTRSELELLSVYRKLGFRQKISVLLQAKVLENPLRTGEEHKAMEDEIFDAVDMEYQGGQA